MPESLSQQSVVFNKAVKYGGCCFRKHVKQPATRSDYGLFMMARFYATNLMRQGAFVTVSAIKVT